MLDSPHSGRARGTHRIGEQKSSSRHGTADLAPRKIDPCHLTGRVTDASHREVIEAHVFRGQGAGQKLEADLSGDDPSPHNIAHHDFTRRVKGLATPKA